MRVITALLIVFVAVFSCSGDAVASVMGFGLQSCGKFMSYAEGRTNNDQVFTAAFLSWTVGYLSAMNQFFIRGNPGRSLLQGLEVEGVRRWMENYCRQKPIDSYWQATEGLANDLFEKKKLPDK